MTAANEFSLIAKYFKPLAAGFAGSLNLSDDAAILTPPAGCELVITKDAISQGIHFIGDEDPALIAGKALRVNLSDLAAMGATPLCYFLALMLPENISDKWLEKFAHGLKETQEKFNIKLAGGDTTKTNGALSISITAIGSVPFGTALRRSGAKIGDDIYVSGTLGDAAFGLKLLLSSRAQPRDLCKDSSAALIRNDNYFINRYLTPQPRINLGIVLRGIANSAMDISDGLAQDLEHICTASNVGAVIYTDKIPLSSLRGGVADKAIQTGSPLFARDDEVLAALTGGDDYELLFTAPPSQAGNIEEIAQKLALPLTCIGKVTVGNSLQILDNSGKKITLEKKGFSHF